METHKLHWVHWGLCLCVCRRQLLPDRGQLPPGADIGPHQDHQGEAGEETQRQAHSVECRSPVDQEAAPVPAEAGL